MDINYYKKYEPIFGSWEIKGLLGEGSFGQVYEIERNELGNTYKSALKTITIPQSESELNSVKADGMTDDEVTAYYKGVVQDIINEFVIMSQMKGTSNIVSYEDHQIIPHDNGIGWDILIRMELLTPIFAYLKEHEPTEKDVVQMGIDICKALELCQKHNIVHRDVKPENIFISQNGDYKLGDFGIARTVEKTMSGLSRKGTFLYMAPEVYLGKSYGSTVDIYSLGLVMYRLLNYNRMPFFPEYPNPITHTNREEALIRRIGGEELVSPAAASDNLAKIILKACAFDPEKRYHSASEMKKELEAILSCMVEDEDESSEAINIDPEFAKAMAAEEESAGTVVLEETYLSGEVAVDSMESEIEDKSTDINGENKKSNKTIAVVIAIVAIVIALILAIVLPSGGVEDVTGLENGTEIIVGETLQPEYVIEPSKYSDQEIKFEVSDERIISVDENGAITAKEAGKAVLIIIVDDYTEEITIVVIEDDNNYDDNDNSYYYPTYSKDDKDQYEEAINETEPSTEDLESQDVLEETIAPTQELDSEFVVEE